MAMAVKDRPVAWVRNTFRTRIWNWRNASYGEISFRKFIPISLSYIMAMVFVFTHTVVAIVLLKSSISCSQVGWRCRNTIETSQIDISLC